MTIGPTVIPAATAFTDLLDKLYHRPPSWEMVTMRRSEVEAMREIIKFQDDRIKDITERYTTLLKLLVKKETPSP